MNTLHDIANLITKNARFAEERLERIADTAFEARVVSVEGEQVTLAFSDEDTYGVLIWTYRGVDIVEDKVGDVFRVYLEKLEEA